MATSNPSNSLSELAAFIKGGGTVDSTQAGQDVPRHQVARFLDRERPEGLRIIDATGRLNLSLFEERLVDYKIRYELSATVEVDAKTFAKIKFHASLLDGIDAAKEKEAKVRAATEPFTCRPKGYQAHEGYACPQFEKFMNRVDQNEGQLTEQDQALLDLMRPLLKPLHVAPPHTPASLASRKPANRG